MIFSLKRKNKVVEGTNIKRSKKKDLKKFSHEIAPTPNSLARLHLWRSIEFCIFGRLKLDRISRMHYQVWSNIATSHTFSTFSSTYTLGSNHYQILFFKPVQHHAKQVVHKIHESCSKNLLTSRKADIFPHQNGCSKGFSEIRQQLTV